MDEYKKYERQCKVIRRENAALLDDFAASLRAQGLSESTVKNHRQNIDFYINEFLLYEDAKPASEGVDEVGMFLGFWFIRKAMWASPASIKAYAASLKKFYAFMHERGQVNATQLEEMKNEIKEELPEWIATVKRYDDPSLGSEEVWRF